MKYTNRRNLPLPIVYAILDDPYSKGDADISVTELIGPPRPRILKRDFKDQIIVDIGDRVASLYGQVMHGILERSGKRLLKRKSIQALFEKRWTIEFEGLKLSGGMDALYHGDVGLIEDYKFVGMGTVYGGVKPEYVAQLNVYAYILRQHGYKITALRIQYLFRDWTEGAVAKNPRLPLTDSLAYDVPVWSDIKVFKYIQERMAVHKAAETKLPECTPSERWFRQNKSIKCEKYCDAKSVCTQWKAIQASTPRGRKLNTATTSKRTKPVAKRVKANGKDT